MCIQAVAGSRAVFGNGNSLHAALIVLDTIGDITSAIVCIICPSSRYKGQFVSSRRNKVSTFLLGKGKSAVSIVCNGVFSATLVCPFPSSCQVIKNRVGNFFSGNSCSFTDGKGCFSSSISTSFVQLKVNIA